MNKITLQEKLNILPKSVNIDWKWGFMFIFKKEIKTWNNPVRFKEWWAIEYVDFEAKEKSILLTYAITLYEAVDEMLLILNKN